MTQDWKENFDKKFASMYLIADERIIELNHNLLKGFISGLLKEERELQNKLKEIAINNLITDVNTARKEERNKVLEEVEKKLRDRIMHDTKDGYSTLYNEVTENLSDEVSTIINNLRVK